MATPLAKENLRQKKRFQAYIEKYIHSPNIDWYWLSVHPLIDAPFVKKWKEKSWNLFWLRENPGLSKEEKIELGCRPPIDLRSVEEFKKIVKENYETYQECIMGLSLYDINIVEDVKNHPDISWDWVHISMNEHITEDFVRSYHRLLGCYWAGNKAISTAFLKEMREKIHVNDEDIATNPNLNEHSMFFFFSEKDLLTKTKINNALAQNPGISVDFILRNPQLRWDPTYVSSRDDITKEHILTYPDFPWDWGKISSAKSIDKNFLRTHPLTNMDCFYSGHCGLTIDEVEHLPPWKISSNMLEGTIEEKADYLRRYHAVRKIGNAFYTCYWFPEYAFCRERLNKRYNTLFGIG